MEGLAALVGVALGALGAGPVAAAPPRAFHALGAVHAAERVRAPATRSRLTRAQRKVESHLRELAWPLTARPPDFPLLRGGRVRVGVRLDAATPAAVAALRARGLEVEIVNRRHALVQGLIEPRALPALAALGAVRTVRPLLEGVRRTGSVDSEGDAAARADLVRAAGYDGTGVVVGVISDGIDDRAAAQASGDLPAVSVPFGGQCRAGSGNEGTAILEIVHDLAPGATLLFSEGISSSLTFIDSVECLRAAGADVIVDDIGFFDEPYFEDGPVAEAVRAAVAAGVSFHSAAGNDADRHYEATFRASPGSDFHDFRAGPVDEAAAIGVPPHETVICILQWNDPFAGSANDYDLYLLDASLDPANPRDQSTTVQSGTQDPIEVVVGVNPTGSARTDFLAIARRPGAAVRQLEMFCLGAGGQEYVTPAGSIIGHPAVSEVVAVAAVDALDPGLDEVEPFSSRGPAHVFFPVAEVRPRPDLAGFDGVSTTNPGGFPDCPPACSFFGTSAAAPHSGAVAALVLGKNPFLSPATVQQVLRTAAADIGPPGVDDAAGAGRLDALAAIAAVSVPECVDVLGCAEDPDPCTVAGCHEGSCVQLPRACDDGDPCTTDVCEPAAGCVSRELAGLAYLPCALAERLRPLVPHPDSAATPRAARTLERLQSRLTRAEARVASAVARGTGPRAQRKLRRARTLVRSMRHLARSPRSGLAPEVAAPIAREAGAIATRIAAVRRAL